MKKTISMRLALLLAALLALSGCSSFTGKSQEEASAYEKIQETLIGLKTYKSEATVKYISNKNENEYATLQHAKITGEYRVEVTGPSNVAGSVTLFDGKTIYQFNPKLSAKVAVGSKESQERNEIFLTSFIKNYLSTTEVSVSAAKIDGEKATVLEAKIPGEHPFLSKEKLWVDNESCKPIKLVVYDKDSSERIVVTYSNFEYNAELDPSLFTVPEA